jgi:proline iminopeptidase
MAEAKLAPNPPDWMVEHANRYLASGGAEGTCTRETCQDSVRSRCRRCS